MLALYVGPSAAGLVPAAARYVRIRALCFPAQLLGNVLQAAMLGARDSATPLIALGVSSGVNALGDLALVVGFRAGLAGAAIATAAAQWAGTGALIIAASRRLVPRHGFGLLNMLRALRARALRGGSAPASTPDSAPAATVPTRQYLGFALPVLTLVLGKIACFGLMTHAAAACGHVSLAAHQLALSIYFFINPARDYDCNHDGIPVVYSFGHTSAVSRRRSKWSR